jgi:hypothetical protein
MIHADYSLFTMLRYHDQTYNKLYYQAVKLHRRTEVYTYFSELSDLLSKRS